MAIDLQAIIIALISALLGGGGVAAWIRAKGQNRTDYLDKLLARISQVEKRTDDQDVHISALAAENSGLHHEQGRLQGESAAQERNLIELRELARVLTGRIGELAQRVADETKERARAIHNEQVQRSKADFLERENNVLRLENNRLRLLLPSRSVIPAS